MNNLYLYHKPLILASASSARHDMLMHAGLKIIVKPARIDEETLKKACRNSRFGLHETTELLAETKGKRVAQQFENDYVLGADQMLSVKIDGHDHWLDKPEKPEKALEQLMLLAGKTHHLVSAAVMFYQGERLWHTVQQADITFRAFSREFAVDYLAAVGQSVLSSVGCYHIEGMGSQLIRQWRGDSFVVRGLPLIELLGFLRQRGLIKE
jgi:septum formation protein